MSKFRDFGTGSSDATAEPISFALYGETFGCNPQLQGKVLLELVAKSSGDDTAAAAQIITQFFQYVLLPDSYVKFDAMLTSTDRIVTLATLSEITAWLVEQYSNRPFLEPEASSPGA